MSALAQLHCWHSPLTQTTLRCQVGNAQAGELFGALLAGFTMEHDPPTLVFDCFGQSGFGDDRGEPYPGQAGDDADVGTDTPLAEAETAVDEAKTEVKRVIADAFGQLEPEPELAEGVPPS